MTADYLSAKYTLAQLSERFAAAVKELQQVDAMLENDCISETFRASTKAYKETLTQYAQLVFESMKIKEH